MINETSEVADVPQVGKRSKANAELRQVIAQRMLDARTLSGLAQTEASGFLGYVNSTQLSLVEQGKRMPPHEVLLRASDLYSVSLDFLLGRSDAPEKNELLAGRNTVMRAAADIIRGSAERLADQLQQQLIRGTRSTAIARNLAVRATKTAQALMLFRQLNVDCFDDLRGGASVLHAVRELQDATATAHAAFNAPPAQHLRERRHRV